MDDTVHTGDTPAAQEHESPDSGLIKLRLVSPAGEPTGGDIGIGRAGFNNHSASIGISPQGINVAWVESAAGDASGVGRIMWQRFSGDLAPANDNATWVTGAVGSEPAVAWLAQGETLLTWVDAKGNGHGHLYPPVEADGDASAAKYAAVNAALSHLGPIAELPDGGRRLQVSETRPGTLAIMWLALADHGFVLRGSMFLMPADAGQGGDAGGPFTEYQIADVRLPPGFTGPFSLHAAGDGSADVIVRSGSGSDANGAVLARRIEGPGTGGEIGHVSPEFPAGAGPVAAARAYADPGRDAFGVVITTEADSDAQPAATGELAPPLVLNIAGSGVPGSEPSITATKDGYAVTWQVPGATDGVVAIRMALFDPSGAARIRGDGSAAITVTDNALASVAPAVAGIGSGAAVAYVDAGGGSLIVKAYDGSGDQVGQDVVVDNGAGGAIGEIALEAQLGGQDEELAVVYVRDDQDDQDDYGSVMLQRYRIPDEESQSHGLIALGGDGQRDGADQPIELTNGSDPETADDVQGRAPTVAGLDDGDLAIVWVENDGARETIRGRVLESDGDQILLIDLTGLLQDSGIIKGTKPILLASGDGDILVSWMQRDDGNEGYVVMAALYQSDGADQWIAPEQAMRLHEFDREPEDFSVAMADHDGTAIDVIWRTDSSGSGSGNELLSKRYDLDGNGIGSTQRLAHSDGDKLSPDALSTAGLIDGQIVVVYTEQDKEGDVDVATHVTDTTSSESQADSAASDSSEASGTDVPPAPASSTALTTSVDREVTVPVAGTGASVSHVNGVPITPAMPVDVGAGWVQLREDGSLTVSPDAGYTGEIAFDYTITGGADEPVAGNLVTIDVEPDDQPAAIALRNQTSSLAENISTAQDIELADIEISERDLSSEGLSLAGLDADLFKIVGTTLYLKAGIDLDFGAKPTLSAEIRDDGHSDEDQAVKFVLNVAGTNGSAAFDELLAADSFLFAPGFGEGIGQSDAAHEVIDVSSSGYATFQELLDSGALVQAGDDVVLTFDPANPDHSDRITLRGIDLSVLTNADFKF